MFQNPTSLKPQNTDPGFYRPGMPYAGRDTRLRSVGNDEREQTLNQLLTELDGFESGGAAAPVICIAATNRPDVRDPYLSLCSSTVLKTTVIRTIIMKGSEASDTSPPQAPRRTRVLPVLCHKKARSGLLASCTYSLVIFFCTRELLRPHPSTVAFSQGMGTPTGVISFCHCCALAVTVLGLHRYWMLRCCGQGGLTGACRSSGRTGAGASRS